MRPSLIICAVLVLSTLGFSRYIVRVVSSQSRILSADHDGLVAKAPDAKPTPTPTTLLTFTPGMILTNPPEALDYLVQVAQQNGQVTITPRANVTGFHYNGVVSNETVDLTTRSVDVAVKQTTKNGAETIFAVGTDFNNFYRFRKVDVANAPAQNLTPQLGLSPNAAGAHLMFEVEIQGAYSAFSVPFDPVAHAFWRFNGNVQNTIEFQTSSDQITWTKQVSISLANNLAVAHVELSAGTSTSVPDPGSTIFQIRPLNDNFANAQSIAGTAGSLPTSNVGATKELGEPNHRGQVGGASVWYRWQAPLSSGVVFGLERPIFGFGLPNLFLDVYSGTSLTNLTAVPSFISGRDQSLTTRTFRATAGTTYYIAVDGVNVSTTDFIDLFWNQITNDDFANAKRIDLSDFASGASFHGFAGTHGATKEPGEPDHAGSPGGASVWYLWQPPVDCTIQVDTDGSYFDTLLAVYTGPNVSNLVVIANDDDGIKPASRLRFKAQAGVTYYIAVDDKNGEGGGLDLHLRVLSTSDDFNSAQLITGASGSINGSNISATKEPGEPNHGGNIGGGSVWYRWQAPVSGSAYFTATGRTETFDAFDALLGVYRGSIVNALSLVTGNDDDYLGAPGSRVGFNVVGGTTYLIAVDGYNGAQSDFALNWWTSGDSIPTSAAPACLPKPRGLSYWNSKESGSAAGFVGSGMTFNGIDTLLSGPSHFDGSSELTVEAWIRNTGTTADDQVILGSTLSGEFLQLALGSNVVYVDTGPIVLPNIPQTPTGTWRHIALSIKSGNTRLFVNGTLTGGSFNTFSIINPKSSASKLRIGSGFNNGNGSSIGNPFLGDIDELRIYNRALSQVEIQAIYNSGSAGLCRNDDSFSTKSIEGASGNIIDNNVGAQSAVPLSTAVWYRWVAPISGIVSFSTEGSDFDTVLTVIGDVVNTSNDDEVGGVLSSRVDFIAVAGVKYLIKVDGRNGQTGNITLKWGYNLTHPTARPPVNDNFADAQVINGSSGSLAGTSVNATKEIGEPNHANGLGGASVWYRWQPPASGTAIINTTGSNFDTLLGVYTGSSINALSLVGSNDDKPPGFLKTSSVTFNAVSGTTYYIGIDGVRGTGGKINLNWSIGGRLSGHVRLTFPHRGPDPLNFESMILGGDLSHTELTDGNGGFSFTNLPVGNYTLSRFVAPPSVPQVTNFSGFADIVDNFDYLVPDPIAGATTITLAGILKATGVGGISYPGVSMTLTCACSFPSTTLSTDNNGAFTFPSLQAGGTYTLTPQGKTDYANLNFSPDHQTFTALNNDVLGVSFGITVVQQLYTISGLVRDNLGNPMSGVTVNLTGMQTASMRTIADGTYSFVGLAPSGPYSVTPSQSGYAFTPFSISNLNANQKTVDFTASPVPTVVTSASTSITSTGATLNGSVNPNGSLTNVWFEWGADPTLTNNTPTVQQAIGAGTNSQAVTANLSSLVASTTYYFRMVASNAAGTLRGAIISFITAAPSMTIQFSTANYTISEGGGHVDTIVTRSGDTGGAASVSFATSDQAGNQNCNVKNGYASSRCDYEARFATVKFAPGETSRTSSIFVIDDSYMEGPETFNVNLSNPVGASLGTPSAATITIADNDLVDGTNQIDTSPFFVRLHYLDFLNREPDASGLSFWMNNINNCTPPPSCTESQRINTSAAFYISIEFQQTGYLVERMYKAAYGDAIGTSTTGGAHSLAVPIVRFNEFLSDTQQVGAGVVVNQTGWETVLENNKQAFALEFVGRSSFTTAFQTTLTPAQFVDQLFANAGVTPLAGDRQTAINEFGSATNTSNATARSRALRDVAENAILSSQEFNRAFVLMQYFGYLRRNPNDPPEATLDYNGYEFWLNKLNQFNGNFVAAEMVKAFITSDEYRHRFGP